MLQLSNTIAKDVIEATTVSRRGVMDAMASILVQAHEVLAITNTSPSQVQGIVTDTQAPSSLIDQYNEDGDQYFVEPAISNTGLKLVAVPNPDIKRDRNYSPNPCQLVDSHHTHTYKWAEVTTKDLSSAATK